MLRVREIRQYGSIAKYTGVDLGRDQGSGRGDATASFYRSTPDEKYECFTFLPDTTHNRVVLLQKNLEVAVQVPGGWRRLSPDEMSEYLAPALGSAEQNGKPAVAQVHSIEHVVPGKPTQVVVNDLEGFLGLGKETQLKLIADGRLPEDALAEVLETKDKRLDKAVRAAAVAVAEKLVNKSAKAA